jgi:hypothetical protein
MTVSTSIDYQSTETKTSLLTIEWPNPAGPSHAVLKIWPFRLTPAEGKEFHEALGSALDYLASFAPQPKVEEVKP